MSQVDGSAVIAKVSWRLMPFLFLLYIVAYLDRTNCGFAKLQMCGDINLSEAAFGFGAGIFFFGYAVFEIPSNLILEKVGARLWIARIMVTWGLTAMAMAWVRGPVSFDCLRFALGVAEAGFFPGVILYLTYWFPQRERARAVATFMTATAISNIVGNPISGFVMKHCDQLSHLAGWQWLFILEGVPALLMGVVVLAWLPDRPNRAAWLTADEAQWLEQTIAAESSEARQRHDLWPALGSGRVWYLAALYFTLMVSLYGLTIWLPSIVKGFGDEDTVHIGLLTALPYLVAAFAMVLAARHSDRCNERRLHVSFGMMAGAIGMALAAASHQPALQLLSFCLAAAGVWSAFGPFWALPTAFLAGTAAAGGIALINSVGNLGGFLGPSVIGWLKTHTSGFAPGVLVMAGFLALGAVLAAGLPAKRE
jgi:ACS family tartrate transporter-like MFS transporter